MNIILYIIVGTLYLFITIVSIDMIWQSPALSDWLYRWQNLIAAAIALVSAIGTISYLARQSKIQQEQLNHEIEKDRYITRKRATAAKAVLPDALSSINEYCEQCMLFVLNHCYRMTERQSERPELPAAAIDNIKEVLPDLEINAIEQMYHFLSEWQVLNSRLKIIEENNASFNRTEMVYKLCLVQAMLHRVYPFARAETNHLTLKQISQDEMHNAFRVLYPHSLMLQRQGVESEYLFVVRRRHN